MKIRRGFVSNSSSSSFVCAVSGTALAGYDGEYEEPVCSAECGHEFLEEYLLPPTEKTRDLSIEGKRKDLLKLFFHDKTKTKLIKKAVPDLIDELFDDNEEEISELYQDSGEVSKSRCPLCQFTKINNNDLAAYLLTKSGKTEKSLLIDIKKEFGDYKSFQKYIYTP